jgi:GTPase SAR1 family protein
MRKIYVLIGVSNSGKTTTLRELISWIIKTFQTKFKLFNVKENNIDSGDINVLFNLIKWNIIIGVSTYGDTRKLLLEAFEIFRINNAKIGFCACKSYGETVDFLKEYASSNSIELVWIYKSKAVNKQDQIECKRNNDLHLEILKNKLNNFLQDIGKKD